eukprot:CAMPEP_0170064432 /NCGR_PEP_ID=MMETSP0019_2-20121128/4921_1 /TAXON_ID=98059 /ORGANISM="Dinobryon sp., Strain UTEXLB2267" /LENGTH=57 /DNA_ID=CAMNT_0010271099 /DNA_START=92 /DNA_END=262 /DNA_ORIENTATION=+
MGLQLLQDAQNNAEEESSDDSYRPLFPECNVVYYHPLDMSFSLSVALATDLHYHRNP